VWPPWTGAAIAGGVVLVLALTTLVISHRVGGAGKGNDVEIEIPMGANASEIAELLANAGVVRDASLFATYLRAFGDATRVKPGPHLLTDDLSAGDLVSLLERQPGGKKAKVTFPEGWSRFDMAKRLRAAHVVSERRFLDATNDKALLTELSIPGESAEGYLFPATYALPVDADAADIVRRLKQEWDRRMDLVRAQHPDAPGGWAKELGWGMPEVMTIASMIEKEAVQDDERPIVSSVFYNRFRDPTFTPKPPKLQSDPTSAYGCLVLRDAIPACSGFTGKITPAINNDPANVWSTYVRAGLPPGPIANPGEKSIGAAIAPADTKFLYFVAKGGGRHAFSATAAEHAEAVKKWREIRAGH
jgi:UPF0755 protein